MLSSVVDDFVEQIDKLSFVCQLQARPYDENALNSVADRMTTQEWQNLNAVRYSFYIQRIHRRQKLTWQSPHVYFISFLIHPARMSTVWWAVFSGCIFIFFWSIAKWTDVFVPTEHSELCIYRSILYSTFFALSQWSKIHSSSCPLCSLSICAKRNLFWAAARCKWAFSVSELSRAASFLSHPRQGWGRCVRLQLTQSADCLMRLSRLTLWESHVVSWMNDVF